MLSGRQAAALRAAVADIPGAALRVPGDEDAAANWEAETRPAAVQSEADSRSETDPRCRSSRRLGPYFGIAHHCAPAAGRYPFWT